MNPNPLQHRIRLLPVLAVALAFGPAVSRAEAPPTPAAHPPTPALTPYLLLDGTCQQAMEFYHACLGGELTLTNVGDSPMKTVFPASLHHKVLNARLVSGSIDLSASDWLRPKQTPVAGNTVCLYLTFASAGELKAIFSRLDVGAAISDPPREEPHGTYGALTDKFGVRWMFHAGPRN